ncbi:MAG: hypothetical protein WKF90_10585 [Pyrinomonadaceae bacterium]
MRKKNNVNPNHYKEEGRERPGQDIVQEIHKQKFTQAQTEQRIQKNEGGSEFIPGGGDAPAINETPVKEMDKDSGQATESANSSSNT